MRGHFGFFAALLIESLMVATIRAGTAVDPNKALILENDFVELKFHPVGMGLVAMIDKKTGYNHIRVKKGDPLLWEIVFGKGLQRESITNNYCPCSFVSIEKLSNGTQHVVLEWNKMRWWKEKNAVSVRVTVDLPRDCGVATWRIFVQNNSDYWGLWSVMFPEVNGFPESSVYNIARPAFATCGLLLKKCKDNVLGRYPSGDWPMQFMSLNDSTNAVYLATMDPDGRAKDFMADASKGELEIVHYPENMGIVGSDWPDCYPVAFGVYQGGWLEAALRYREWAIHQKWAKLLSDRYDFPLIMRDLGLWVRDFWIWDSAEGLPHQMDLPLVSAGKEMGVPMGIHWYFWNQNEFDNLYPEFFPPRRGFAERVKELVGKGFLVMPYINGRSADMNILDWKEYASHAIYDQAGGFIMDTTNLSGRLVEMCPSQEFWQSKITALADSLVSYYGCNGVYVDQVSAMRDELCFNPHHGHPLGGGRWWTDGNRKMMRMIRYVARLDGYHAAITSEGADEIFLDLVDGNLFWLGPTDREIPLINVVYSGYAIFFGSPCDYEKCSEQLFNFAQGQAFIYGRQNGWMDLGLLKPEYAAKAAYLRLCGQYRAVTKKFLLYGRLLGPVIPMNEVCTFTDGGFGRWRRKHTGTVPAVEAAVWKSEDDHLGVFMANFVNKEVPFSFSIDPERYGVKCAKYELAEITPQGKIPIRIVSGAAKLDETLRPSALKVIEITPVSNQR